MKMLYLHILLTLYLKLLPYEIKLSSMDLLCDPQALRFDSNELLECIIHRSPVLRSYLIKVDVHIGEEIDMAHRM